MTYSHTFASVVLLLLCFFTGSHGETTVAPKQLCKNENLTLKDYLLVPVATYEAGLNCTWKIQIPANYYARYNSSLFWYSSYIIKTPILTYESESFDEKDRSLPGSTITLTIFNDPEAFDEQLEIWTVPYVFTSMKTVNLEVETWIRRDYDFLQEGIAVQLTAEKNISLRTICAYDFFGVKITLGQIFVLDGSKNVVNTLAAVEMTEKVFSNKIILYPAGFTTFSPCTIIAMSPGRKEQFSRLMVDYPLLCGGLVNSTLYKDFELEATLKPAALLLVSRDAQQWFDIALQGTWLFPPTIPNGSTLSIFGGFPSKLPNTTHLLYNYTSTNSPEYPVFFSGLARTFLLDTGKITLTLGECWTSNKTLPAAGLKFTLASDPLSLGSAKFGQRSLFADNSTVYSYNVSLNGKPEACLKDLCMNYADDDHLFASMNPINGTVVLSSTAPNFSVSAGVSAEIWITDPGNSLPTTPISLGSGLETTTKQAEKLPSILLSVVFIIIISC